MCLIIFSPQVLTVLKLIIHKWTDTPELLRVPHISHVVSGTTCHFRDVQLRRLIYLLLLLLLLFELFWLYSPCWSLVSSNFRSFCFLWGWLTLTPNPQLGGPRYPFMSRSLPLTCLEGETLPAAKLPPA
jgi:hypothetical protein